MKFILRKFKFIYTSYRISQISTGTPPPAPRRAVYNHRLSKLIGPYDFIWAHAQDIVFSKKNSHISFCYYYSISINRIIFHHKAFIFQSKANIFTAFGQFQKFTEEIEKH